MATEADTNPYNDDFEWPSTLYREMRDISTVAFFIYQFGYLIDAARDESEPLVGVTTNEANKINNKVGDYGRSFTPAEVKSLIQDNRKRLKSYGKEFNNKNVEILNIILDKLQARADEFPDMERPLVVEAYDDRHQKKECVYGIVRDSTNKRLTLCFRGTNKLSLVKNWLSNVSILKEKVEIPDMLKGKVSEDNLNFHSGFYNYLFKETEDESDEKGTTKYDQILEDLKELTVKYPDHKVYVTGHSLGAALSGLCSFFLACEPDLPKPISCINFASPRFGGEIYYESSQYLEKTKQLRMLRSVNNNDSIASVPSVGYYHGGISCTMEKNGWFFKAGKPSIEYRKMGSRWWSKLSYDLSQSAWTSLNIGYDHGDYISRIKLHKEELEKYNFNKLYTDEDLTGFKLEDK